jgi:hypothetical protein
VVRVRGIQASLNEPERGEPLSESLLLVCLLVNAPRSDSQRLAEKVQSLGVIALVVSRIKTDPVHHIIRPFKSPLQQHLILSLPSSDCVDGRK